MDKVLDCTTKGQYECHQLLQCFILVFEYSAQSRDKKSMFMPVTQSKSKTQIVLLLNIMGHNTVFIAPAHTNLSAA